MTSVFHLINNKYSSLSRSERTVAEYILQNPAAVMLLSMRGLAEKINLSDNTVLRFCRTCGFSGYLDFKTALLPQVVTESGSIYKQVDTRDRFTLQREKISKNLSTTIRETYGNTREEEITLVARRIAASQHTYLVGLAPSAGVARIFADSLRVIGVPSSPLADRIEIERTCLSMRSGSVLIGLTHSGETEEVLVAVRRARENGAFTVLISNNIAAQQEVVADVYLFTQVPAENMAGVYFTLPRIAQLALVELIVSQIPMFVEKRGETNPSDRGEEGGGVSGVYGSVMPRSFHLSLGADQARLLWSH